MFYYYSAKYWKHGTMFSLYTHMISPLTQTVHNMCDGVEKKQIFNWFFSILINQSRRVYSYLNFIWNIISLSHNLHDNYGNWLMKINEKCTQDWLMKSMWCYRWKVWNWLNFWVFYQNCLLIIFKICVCCAGPYRGNAERETTEKCIFFVKSV